MVKSIFLLSAILLLIHGLLSITENIEFDEKIKSIKELTTNLDQTSIENKINLAIDEHKLEHAKNLIIISKLKGFPIDEQYFLSKIEEQESLFNSMIHNSGSFYNGFIYGKGDNIYSISGAVSSDFLVIGDVRTLSNELNKEDIDQDKLNIALSSLGIVLTVGTVATAGSLGVGKFWVSFFKIGKSSKLINNKLSSSLYNGISKSINFKKIKNGNFKDVVNKSNIKLFKNDINNLDNAYKNIGSKSGTLQSLKYMNTTSDFKQFNNLSIKYKSLTPTILKLAGRAALVTTKVIKFTFKLIMNIVELLSSLLLFIFSSKR